MKGKPGISWGPDEPINLVEKKNVFYAIFYNVDPPEIIRIFKKSNPADMAEMYNVVTLWNYGTCDLCPIVKAEMDAQS